MKPRLASSVLAGLLWAAGAGAAPATPAENPNFALLARVCIATHADHDAALAAGQAAGLTLPSPNGATGIVSNLQFEDADVRGKLAGDRVVMVIVGHKATTLAGQPVIEDLCAIASAVPDGDADAQFRAWIASPPASDHNGNPFFVFTGEAGSHQSAATYSEADAAAAIHQGDMQTAAVLHLPDTTVLVYGKFEP